MARRRYNSLEEAFWLNVEKRKRNECWHWKPNVLRQRLSYGTVQYQNIWYLAHRLSYELHYGPILPHVDVLHTCDVKWCVNPRHLKLGGDSDNFYDTLVRGFRHPVTGQRTLRGNVRLSLKDVQDIRNLRGIMSYADIAGAYDISYWTVQAVQNGKRWSAFADTGKKHTRQYMAERGRFTEVTVREMRALAGSMTWKALGEQFGTDGSTARRICLGERWGEVPMDKPPVKKGRKLTERQAAEIMHMRGCRSAKETAKMYSLSEVQVHAMWRNAVPKWAYLHGGLHHGSSLSAGGPHQ